MNKSYKKICVFACYIIFITAGFIYGYNKGKDISYANDEISQKQNEANIAKNEPNKTVVKQEIKITPSTRLEYICHYTSCNHTETKVKNPTGEIIGMNEEEYMEYLTKTDPTWEMLVFGADKIVMSVSKEHLCPKHFIIGVNEDRIIIHKVGQDMQIQKLPDLVEFKIYKSGIKYVNKLDSAKNGLIPDLQIYYPMKYYLEK